MNEETRGLLLTFRQTLLMQLGALEEFLRLPRSVQPKRKKPLPAQQYTPTSPSSEAEKATES